jgi:quercetin dioxygenase-like cupin family protein
VLVLDGTGSVRDGDGAQRIGPEAVVNVAPDELHGFRAEADTLRLVCLDGPRE